LNSVTVTVQLTPEPPTNSHPDGGGMLPENDEPVTLNDVDPDGGPKLPSTPDAFQEADTLLTLDVLPLMPPLSTTPQPAVGDPLTAVTVTNALGHATTTTLDQLLGKPVSVTDANRRKTHTAYDALGRIVQGWAPGRTPRDRQSEHDIRIFGTNGRSIGDHDEDFAGKRFSNQCRHAPGRVPSGVTDAGSVADGRPHRHR